MSRHILSIDFEEWFQVKSFAGLYSVADWGNLESRLELQTDRLLELLDQKGVKATFFTVGWIARKHRDLIIRIADRGHEIGSHGNRHMPLPEMGASKFREDLIVSKKKIEDIIQKPVTGFRAPNWSLTDECEWAVDILSESGFRYDSSIFPIRLSYGRRQAPRFPYRFGNGLWEFPLSVLRVVNQNVPVSGGIFFRAFPLPFIRYAVRQCESAHAPFILYLHPWEIDPGHPRIRTGIKSTLIHYHNLHQTYRKLTALLDRFTFTSFSDVMGEAAAA